MNSDNTINKEETRKLEENEKFEELKNKVYEYVVLAKKLCESMNQYQFNKMTEAEFDRFISYYVQDLKLMEFVQQAYRDECAMISKCYVDINRIDKLIDIINRTYDIVKKIVEVCFIYTKQE